MKRFACILGLTSSLAVVAPQPGARAGERASIPALVERSLGAVVADVELETKRSPNRLQVVRVIRGLDATIEGTPSWVGFCTGTVQFFKLWLHAHPKWPAAKQWRAALAKRAFRAVLFIHPSRTTGELVPYCETEAMLMEHTSLHPGFDDYVRKVEFELNRREAKTGR